MPPSTLPFRVPFSATKFPPGALVTSSPLIFTADDLAHALFVTGRAPGDRAAHGAASVWEWVHRSALVPAYVRRLPKGRLRRSALALDLDRSEKVAVSYALGQALTQIFCETGLGVGYLMHLDRYGARFGAAYAATRKRADLIGLGPTGWVVAEAKGRSNGMEAALRGKLIAQKRSVRSIAGVPPALALGCVTSFPPPAGDMRLDAFDPTESDLESIDVEVDVDSYLLAYYEPFLAALDAGSRDDADGVARAVFAGAGVTMGLRRDVEQRARAAAEGAVQGLAADLLRLRAGRDNEEEHLDGSYFQTEWQEALTLGDFKG